MMPPDPAATTLAATVLRAHFGEAALQRVVSTRREFPQHLKLDVVESIRTQLAPFPVTPLGIHQKYPFMAITFAGLSVLSQDPERLAPVQYQDVDIGDDRPVPCLAQGLWLFAVEGAPVAVLFSQNVDPGRVPVVNVEIAYLDERTIPFVEVFLTRVAADSARSARYCGKILSLDGSQLYSGLAAPLKVHRLSRRERSSMILPESVMERIDEQIFGFEAQKAILKKYGQSLRKGVLLYGPPGNGKTHLINYIISNLPDRTAILLLGTDVGQLMRYMELARTLQPALIVIEDVDVIGRSRDQITHPAMEATLNRLLNEMDGLGPPSR